MAEALGCSTLGSLDQGQGRRCWLESERVNPTLASYDKKEFNFHPGEFYLQTAVGVGFENGVQLSKYIREFMPAQHREFYEKLPFLLASSLDSQGRTWASILTAQPPPSPSSGEPLPYQAPTPKPLARTPNDRTIHFEASVLPGDPFHANLRTGGMLGVLGIEPHTRRRNRVNGKVRDFTTAVESEAKTSIIDFDVDQSFGNCPKYIQAREWDWKDRTGQVDHGKVERGHNSLPQELERVISASDSLYIASASLEARDATLSGSSLSDKRQGLDISHRGGKPGFVSVLRERKEGEEGYRTVLEWPEYIGNFMFNTLGNIITNPSVGMLFIDYENGDLLYLTGKAQLALGARSKPGAQHTLRFELDEWIHSTGVLPFEWKYISESMYNPETEFSSAEEGQSGTRITDKNKLGIDALKVQCVKVVEENHEVTTYTFSTGVALGSFQKAGQYATFSLDLGPSSGRVERTWTISSAGGAGSYDISISVKAKPGGLVSNWLKANMVLTKEVILKGIEGTFNIEALRPTTKRLLLFAGGIGITPFLSMLRWLKNQQRTLGAFLSSSSESVSPASNNPLARFESIDLVYSVREPRDLVFGGELVDLSRNALEGVLRVHFYLTGNNLPRVWNGGRGRVTLEAVLTILEKDKLNETEAMVCGPPAFMQSIESLLEQAGLEEGRLHSENFNF